MSASRMLSAPEISRTALGLRSVGVLSGAIRRDFASLGFIAFTYLVVETRKTHGSFRALTLRQHLGAQPSGFSSRGLPEIRYVGARLAERDSWLRAYVPLCPYVPVLVSGWNLIIARTPSATKTVSTAS